MKFTDKIMRSDIKPTQLFSASTGENPDDKAARNLRKKALESRAEALLTRIHVAVARIQNQMSGSASPDALQKLHTNYTMLQDRINAVTHALKSNGHGDEHHFDDSDPEHHHEHEHPLHLHLPAHGLSPDQIGEFHSIVNEYEHLTHERRHPDQAYKAATIAMGFKGQAANMDNFRDLQLAGDKKAVGF